MRGSTGELQSRPKHKRGDPLTGPVYQHRYTARVAIHVSIGDRRWLPNAVHLVIRSVCINECVSKILQFHVAGLTGIDLEEGARLLRRKSSKDLLEKRRRIDRSYRKIGEAFGIAKRVGVDDRCTRSAGVDYVSTASCATCLLDILQKDRSRPSLQSIRAVHPILCIRQEFETSRRLGNRTSRV